MGVDTGGPGDQGMMFGFTCKVTPEFRPMPIEMAHRLVRRLSEVRRSGRLPYLRPDGKTQVTVEYQDGRPIRIDTVVVSTQHDPAVATEDLRRDVEEQVIRAVIPEELRDRNTRMHINPTGRFVIGRPRGATPLDGPRITLAHDDPHAPTAPG